jgi:hypothetical protein
MPSVPPPIPVREALDEPSGIGALGDTPGDGIGSPLRTLTAPSRPTGTDAPGESCGVGTQESNMATAGSRSVVIRGAGEIASTEPARPGVRSSLTGGRVIGLGPSGHLAQPGVVSAVQGFVPAFETP